MTGKPTTHRRGRAVRSAPSHASETIVDVRSVDWNRAWQYLRTRKGSPTRDSLFWDGRASSFREGASESEYVDGFLAIMEPRPEWTVLDMGCGSGTLAIPLARRVSSVTAVDFSPGMLEVVRNRCAAEGVGNVTTLQASWDDDWTAKDIGVHDVAIASRSMVGRDLKASITKLDGVARKGVYIATIVGDGPYDRRLFEAIGRPLHRGPDYIYNYNLLYQMGIPANVGFIKERRQRAYESIDHAAEALRWMVGNLTADEKERLAAYLQSGAAAQEGRGSFTHTTDILWAVIWWDTSPGRFVLSPSP